MAINFRSSDFQELEYTYVFVNQTSGTDCILPGEITAQAFTKDGITLRVPTNSCNTNHLLMILVSEGKRTKYPKRIPLTGDINNLFFNGIGKIQTKDLDENDKKYSYVKIHFTQFDQEEWAIFTEQYSVKQDELANLIRDAVSI